MIHRFRVRGSRPAVWVQPVQLILLAAGLALLGYAGFTLLRAHLYQTYEGRALDRISLNRPAKRAQPGLAGTKSGMGPYHFLAPARAQPIARIEIPSVGLNTLVLQGDDAETLRLGAGHIAGTALPGEPGNVGIAGHRDTFFRCLRDIEKNDAITLRTRDATYIYRVETVSIVAPSEVEILGPTADNTLTLVTCYPFHFVGAAPRRFIIRARQVSISEDYAANGQNAIPAVGENESEE